MLIPSVIEKNANGIFNYDIYSRLLEDRIIFLPPYPINAEIANSVIAQMLYLESKDKNKDIFLYIDNPGGEVYSGMAIIDTMNFISCDVSTICVGLAASMASLILASGAKGKRFALPHSRIMIHQPHSAAEGQTTDILIQANESQRVKEESINLLSKATGKTIDEVTKDMDRDNYMTSKDAKEYGIIDDVMSARQIKTQ